MQRTLARGIVQNGTPSFEWVSNSGSESFAPVLISKRSLTPESVQLDIWSSAALVLLAAQGCIFSVPSRLC